jgi:hypothetical protein
MVCLDAVLLFATPLLSAPAPRPIDLAVVRFLQANIGLQRFMTLGPIQPNFGSYFGIAEVNVNDLPIPKSYVDYVTSHLNHNTDPLTFTGAVTTDAAGPSNGQELSANLANYEDLGVKYVVVPGSGLDSSGVAWPPPAEAPVVKLVYDDSLARVYQLPHPAPLFSAEGADCSVVAEGWDRAKVSCPRPARLVRREQALPGWTATVAGKGEPVTTTDAIFQATTVPAGVSIVQFTFGPPHVLWAWLASLLAVVALIAALVVAVRRRREPPAVLRSRSLS